jgi:hypothetical protein
MHLAPRELDSCVAGSCIAPDNRISAPASFPAPARDEERRRGSRAASPPPVAFSSHSQRAVDGDHGRAARVDVVDDLGVIDALEVIDVMPRLVRPSWRWMTINARSTSSNAQQRPRAKSPGFRVLLGVC